MKRFFSPILRFENLTWIHWTFLFAIFLLAHIPVTIRDRGNTNLAVMQADAFLRGRLNIDSYYWDTSSYHGKYYVCFPPFPSIVALPFAALPGKSVNSVLISLLLTCLSMYVFYRILQRIMPDPEGRKWIFLAFFFGTGYWYTVISSHHVNGFAHVVCTTMLMLLLYELTGKRRPVLLGFFLGAAFLSRQMTVFHGLVVAYVLFFSEEKQWEGFKKVLVFGISFSVAGAVYLLFNYLRFDNPLETGYKYFLFEGITNWPEVFQTRIEKYGLFNIKYFCHNLYYLLIKGHDVTFTGRDHLTFSDVNPYGTSLLAASPFVVASFKSKAEKGFKIVAWTTIGLIVIGGCLYHNNGWQQVNTQRFTIDFLPVMMVLVAKGYHQIPRWLFHGMVVFAIGLNIISFLLHA